MNILRFESHTETNDFLEGFVSHGFIYVISKPTRITTSSATLIDHMDSNHIISSYHSSIIINDVADHLGILCIYEGKSKHSSQTSSKHRSFNAENMINFRDMLKETDFEKLLKLNIQT